MTVESNVSSPMPTTVEGHEAWFGLVDACLWSRVTNWSWLRLQLRVTMRTQSKDGHDLQGGVGC